MNLECRRLLPLRCALLLQRGSHGMLRIAVGGLAAHYRWAVRQSMMVARSNCPLDRTHPLFGQLPCGIQCCVGCYAVKLESSVLFNSFLAGASKGNKPCTPQSVWPLPIPFWIDASTEGDEAEAALKRAINAMVMVLNWLHLKSPAHIPKNFDAFAPLTEVQQTVVERLRRFCIHWLEAGEIAAEDMGRTASKVEDLEGQLAYLSGLADRLKASTGSGRAPMVVGHATSPFPGEPTLAKDIEAHRLKFTGVPAFDPRDWLTDEARVWYDKPLDCSLPPEEHFDEVAHV